MSVCCLYININTYSVYMAVIQRAAGYSEGLLVRAAQMQGLINIISIFVYYSLRFYEIVQNKLIITII